MLSRGRYLPVITTTETRIDSQAMISQTILKQR